MRRLLQLPLVIGAIYAVLPGGSTKGEAAPQRQPPLVSWVQATSPTTLATFPFDSEGLTVNPGTATLYVAESPDNAGECHVRSISMSGVVTSIGVVPRINGAACAPRGAGVPRRDALVADQAAGDAGWVFRMDPATGQADIFASGVPGANGIAFDGHGHLWITDSLRGQGRVYRRHAVTGTVEKMLTVRRSPMAPCMAVWSPLRRRRVWAGRSSTCRSGLRTKCARRPTASPSSDGDRPRRSTSPTPHAVPSGPRHSTSAATWCAGQRGCNGSLQPDTLCEDAVFVPAPAAGRRRRHLGGSGRDDVGRRQLTAGHCPCRSPGPGR